MNTLLIVSGIYMCLYSMPVNVNVYAKSVDGDPKVWLHLLQELSSRCEHSAEIEKTCSKTIKLNEAQ